MAYIITGSYRVRAGHENEFIQRMERVRELLARRGQGLRYYALTRSRETPHLFGGVVIWETREDEQRMVHDPERQALVRAINIASLLDEPPVIVAGPAVFALPGRADHD